MRILIERSNGILRVMEAREFNTNDFDSACKEAIEYCEYIGCTWVKLEELKDKDNYNDNT